MLSGQVGIFWFVGKRGVCLVHDGVPVDGAEDYGDFKTYDGGHYEFWEELRASGPAALKGRDFPEWIADHEYEDFPRGRIVYEIPEDTFIIYIDRKLNNPKDLSKIKKAFDLLDVDCEVRFDRHYQSNESIK